MEVDEAENIRALLVRTLQWLAADGETTVAAVPAIAATGDEIANELDVWFESARGRLDLDASTISALAEIDDGFDAMSRPELADLWTDEAIVTSEAWRVQRERARRALVLLGEGRDDHGLRGRV